MIEGLEEHQLLVFWTQLFVLVGVARTFGYAMRRIGLPTVVGELLAGVVLGPTVFGRVWADGFAWFLPDDAVQGGMLQAVGWFGVALLLIVTGFETDLALISRLGRAAGIVSVGSIVVPLAAGLALGAALPDSLFGPEATRLSFTLFIGAALAVSSLAVVAKILSELGFMRRDFGQITVAAGVANDVFGWLMLGAIAAVAANGEFAPGDLLPTFAGMAAFLLLALTVGQRLVDDLLRIARREGENLGAGVFVVVLVALGFAALTQWIGVEGVLGAFVAGIILGRSRFQQDGVLEHVETITAAVLAPIFFATAGLRVDLGLLVEDDAVGWAVLLVVVALVAKFVGAFGGAMGARLTRREGVALGAGLNARGALEIVIATVGLSLGVLNDTAYTAVVLVPIVTSVAASVGLRLSVRGWPGTRAEQERLEKERALAANVLVKPERLLLPSRGRPNSIVAAQLLHFVWPEESGVTVLAVTRDDGEEVDLAPVINVLAGRDVEVREIPWDDAAAQVAAEARLGFGAIAIGVDDVRAGEDRELVSPFAISLLGEVDVPVVITRRGRNLERDLPGAFSRAIVPVSGTKSSRAAQELAVSLSADLGTEIVLTHVVDRALPSAPLGRLFARLQTEEMEATDVADRLLHQAATRMEDQGVHPRREVRHAVSPADELVRFARQEEADLVILGASARQIDDHTFLGHTVEQVLTDSDATVVIVVSPDQNRD